MKSDDFLPRSTDTGVSRDQSQYAQTARFDSPNQEPLATIGITINENEHLVLPTAKGALGSIRAWTRDC
jgi:hypothetical protein